jgi:hypothetical protein
MDTTDSRWLYASKSSSTDKMFESVVAGTRGAEFVRFVKLGRAVLRGVEFEVVGNALVGRSPRLGSLDEFGAMRQKTDFLHGYWHQRSHSSQRSRC